MSAVAVRWYRMLFLCIPATVGFYMGHALTSGSAASPASQAESLEVRYARLWLQLAETNLQRAQRANQRVANAVPANVVAEYRARVDVARARLESSQAAKPDQLAFWQAGAAAAHRAAEVRYQSASAANARMANTIDPGEVERLRLRTALAELQVERGRAVAGAAPAAQLRWQLEVLFDQVDELREENLPGRPSGPVLPLWRWW